MICKNQKESGFNIRASFGPFLSSTSPRLILSVWRWEDRQKNGEKLGLWKCYKTAVSQATLLSFTDGLMDEYIIWNKSQYLTASHFYFLYPMKFLKLWEIFKYVDTGWTTLFQCQSLSWHSSYFVTSADNCPAFNASKSFATVPVSKFVHYVAHHCIFIWQHSN